MVERRALLKAGGVVGVPVAVGVGVEVFPIRPRLYDVQVDNRRSDVVSLDMRLDADGDTAFQSTIAVPADELLHLSCEWPRVAWSYKMTVRLTDRNDWQTIQWRKGGKLCKQIVINKEDTSLKPVSFYESGSCPKTLDDHSCE
jgi:hypothetical protein